MGRGGDGVWRGARAAGVAALAAVLALIAAPLPAVGAEALLVGEWGAAVPDVVVVASSVTANWYLSVNVGDDGDQPAAVDNVTATFTVVHGTFDRLPIACRVDGVTPPSGISADGRSLVCNLGTQAEGTALRLATTVVADGVGGEAVELSGSYGGEEVTLDPVPIATPFGLDMAWGDASPNSYQDGTGRVFTFQWTLFHNRRAAAGPQDIDIQIQVDGSVSGDWQALSCGAFTSGPVAGHPWSGGGHEPDRTAPFVRSCTVSVREKTPQSGDAVVVMHLSGIDYSQVTRPTKDSRGKLLPAGTAAVASGEIVLRQVTTAATGNVAITASAPEYTAQDQNHTLVKDDPKNNAASVLWTSGTISGWWTPSVSGSNAGALTNTYTAPIGARVSQRVGFAYRSAPASAASDRTGGLCSILDPKYVTFESASLTLDSGEAVGSVATATIEYYVGSDPQMDPRSAAYNPDAWRGCGAANGWTSQVPADRSSVKAVRAVYQINERVRADRVGLDVVSVIKPGTPVGQDVWMWATYANATTTTLAAADWRYYTRVGGSDLGTPLPTPGLRYPWVSHMRDVLRVVATRPVVTETVDQAAALPGATVRYSLTYEARGNADAIRVANGFELVETLPPGVMYVPGSATATPKVTVAGGRQVLTWVFDGLAVNRPEQLSFDVTLPAGATPGAVVTDSVRATVDGTTANSSAPVWIMDMGVTRLSKTSGSPVIANPDGTGTGTGTWQVAVSSADPVPQSFTDVIDVLPYVGDGRRTQFTGSYEITAVDADPGSTVYYTQADPSLISADPAGASNGSAGSVTGNTVGWTTDPTPHPTAIRVIGGSLAPQGIRSFQVEYRTQGMSANDVLENAATARAGRTRLAMRASAVVTVAPFSSAVVRKSVLSPGADPDDDASWLDADDAAGYPVYAVGEPVPYRVCVTNTGQGVLHDVVVSDDLHPDLGGFGVAALAVGQSECRRYDVVYDDSAPGVVVDTASAQAVKAGDDPLDPGGPVLVAGDAAGVRLLNQGFTVTKSPDVGNGTTVQGEQAVRYTITLRNGGGTEATVDLTDHLADVLDDAAIVPGSLQTGPGADVPIAARLDEDAQVIRVAGYLPAGATATVSYTVQVAHDGPQSAVLRNVVTATGERAPDACPAGDARCTENPVERPLVVPDELYLQLPLTGGPGRTGGVPPAVGIALVTLAGVAVGVFRRRRA
ncbi:DUF11 domain-containing protein [Xylanimonas allomyrinae]|uniref:DUF11 domain-containing protein n=1 Tax=Xylanimonas allomyrinae TaxID=2509459 RepID=A0A4P6EZR1_9MICO|nr:DUF11 domain-containing protein [Xylanimonas allomyrinae]QAY63568.1 DUF11 domain-containing protein [Xylanimonas allomyrinae]